MSLDSLITDELFINTIIELGRPPIVEEFNEQNKKKISFEEFKDYIQDKWPWLYYKIKPGEYGESYKCIKPVDYWKHKENRHRAIKLVFESEGRKDIIRGSFKKHKVFIMLRDYYEEQPLKALQEALPNNEEVRKHPWKFIKQLPKGYWGNKKEEYESKEEEQTVLEHRLTALRYVFENNIGAFFTRESFKGMGLLGKIYKDQPYAALKALHKLIEDKGALSSLPKELRKEYEKINECPWTIVTMPDGYWHTPTNRYKAIRWLFKKEKHNKIGEPTFHDNGLGGMLYEHYDNSTLRALQETLIENEEVQKHPWQFMKKMPDGFWDDEEVRLESIRWLYYKEGKTSIGWDTFDKHTMRSMLERFYEASPLKALQKALPDEYNVQHMPEKVVKRVPNWY